MIFIDKISQMANSKNLFNFYLIFKSHTIYTILSSMEGKERGTYISSFVGIFSLLFDVWDYIITYVRIIPQINLKMYTVYLYQYE